MDQHKNDCYCPHRKRLITFFSQILRESNLHGVKYIGLPDRHIVERVFWLVAVLFLTGFSFYLVEEVFKKYYQNPVIISFQPKDTYIAQIPFPAITVCNVNIMKRQIMKEAFDNLVESLMKFHNTSEDTDLTALEEHQHLSEHLAHYCLAAPSVRRLLNYTMVDPSGEIDFVENLREWLVTNGRNKAENLTRVFEKRMDNITRNFRNKASHSCEDMILKCMWSREQVSCKKIFHSIHTHNGKCCVFNMMPKYILRKFPKTDKRAKREREKLTPHAIEQWESFGDGDLMRENDNLTLTQFPRRQTAGGKPYGLSILINPELDVYSTCTSNDAWGFKVIAHSPLSFPNLLDYGIAVPPSSEVFVDIEPQVTTADEDVLKSVGVNKRGCLLPSDKTAKLKYYKFYSAGNCLDECFAKQTQEICSCVRYYMPRNESQKLCGAQKLACAEEVRVNLTTTGKAAGSCSDCRPACTEIKYKIQMSQIPLRKDATAPFFYNTTKESNKTALNYTIMHVYFGTESLYAKERKTLFDIPELLANAGGLLSLTLGFSIISLVEIVYFCTLRLWFKLRCCCCNTSDNDSDEDDFSDDDDDNYYGMDSGKRMVNEKGAKLSAFVSERVRNNLQNNKAIGYYNWAFSNEVLKSKHIMVMPGQESKKVPNFHLLAGTNAPLYPFMS